MKKTELIVEIGSTNIVVAIKKGGIVLREASVVAVDIETEKVIEWGDKAKKLLGKVNAGVDIFYPVKHGVIKHKRYASFLLKSALNKVFQERQRGTLSITFIVRIGLSKEEIADFKQIAHENSIGEVLFLEEPLASLKGAGVNTSVSSAYMSLNIGGGVVNMAIISHDKIVNGLSISLGGLDMDEAIAEYVSNMYNMEISVSQAEKIKTYCGSLNINDTSNMEVMGMDKISKIPCKEIISANDVNMAIVHFFDLIADHLQKLLNMCSPDIVADVVPNGIYLSGGVASLGGIEDFLYLKTGMNTYITELPENNPFLI